MPDWSVLRRRMPVIAAILAVAAGAALISLRSTYEPDLWWHLAQGREDAAGHLVRTNLFSFTYRDYAQPYTSWLFDLAAWWLWNAGGAAPLQIAQGLLIAASLGLIAAACRMRASAAATVAVCLFGWLVLEPRALPRPHVFSFVGLAACAWLIERARVERRARPLVWLAPLMIVWANVHVECMFGLAFAGLFAGGEWLRPRDLPRREAAAALAWTAVASAATLLNPYGFGIVRYLYENALVPQVIAIAELQPAYLPNYRGFFAWAILAAFLMTVRRREVTLADLLPALAFAALGFRHLRLTPMLFFVSAPLVARCVDGLQAYGIDRRAAAIASAAAVVFMSRVPLPYLITNLHVGGDALMPPALFSEEAMRFARGHHMEGPVFTSLNLGGFVAWELYPSALVFQDARLQAYPPAHFRTIMAAAGDPSRWEALTAGVQWAVLSLPRVNELSGVGQFASAEWGTAYRDAAIEIVVRRAGPYGSLAAAR